MNQNIFDSQEKLDFIQSILESWSGVTLDNVNFERFSWGFAREVYKVTALDSSITPNPIVLRKFADCGGIHDASREKEDYVFKMMSDSGFGPTLYGANPNYQVEEYINSKNIDTSHLMKKSIRRKLALKFGEMHKLQPTEIESSQYILKRLNDEKLIENFKAACNLDIFDEEEAKFVAKLKADVTAEELDWINDIIPKENLVFSHNDIWQANILVTIPDSEVKIIDYETSGYNFPGYDLGALFRATVWNLNNGLDYYEENYPSDEEIIDFLRFYLISRVGYLSKEDQQAVLASEATLSMIEKRIFTDESEHKKMIKDLLRQTKIGTMVMAIYIAILAMTNNKAPNFKSYFMKLIKYDYSTYLKFKEIIKNDK